MRQQLSSPHLPSVLMMALCFGIKRLEEQALSKNQARC